MLEFGSVCSGVEAASVAWLPLGWTAAWLAEIEPFPSAVLAHRYPDTPNLGDMTALPDAIMLGEVAAPDVLVGGTPCFTRAALVLTSEGYRPIDQITPGDLVVTHAGRLMPVLRTGSKTAEVGRLKAVGLPETIETTPGHPFLSVDWRNHYTKSNGRYAKVEHCSEPVWERADNMKGKQWASLIAYDIAPPDLPLSRFTEDALFFLAGCYVGDGHIRRWRGSNKKTIVLSLNATKEARFSERVRHGVTPHKDGSVTRLHIGATREADWLLSNFGEYSHSKTLPAWLLAHERREAFLEGYLLTDGSKDAAGAKVNTVSRCLAYGTADLFNSLGYTASVSKVRVATTKVIEGRTVNQRDWYSVQAFKEPRKSRVRHGYLLRKAQDYVVTGTDEVFNLEVQGDNSYIVNGAVVHNCQGFSMAGLRGSLDDPRGQLTLTYVKLLNAIDEVRKHEGKQPAIAVWENVPGVLNTKDNAFGNFLAALAGESEALQPPGRRWGNAGYIIGPHRQVAWRVLDAQYFGLAQRRKRVFVVASAGTICPATVLFEFEGVRRDSAPGRVAGQDAAGAAADSTDATLCMAHGQANAEVTTGASPTLTCVHEAPIVTVYAGTQNDACRDAGADISPTIRAGNNGGAVNVVVNTPAVRRLTPRECERLQGFPDIRKTFTMSVSFDGGTDECLGHQKSFARAETKSLRSHSNVSHAGESEYQSNARAAVLSLNAGQESSSEHVLVNVLIDSERQHLQLHSAGRLLLSVSTAELSDWCRLPIKGGDFVQLIARINTFAAKGTTHGEADSQLSMTCSTHRQNGSEHVQLCGHAISELVSDAGTFTSALRDCLKSTTSAVEQSSQNYDLSRKTLFSCVAAVICSCIPGQTHSGSSFDISIETVSGWTQIPWRGKPAGECPDGHRYKALGNSMAVPVMRWIGARITAQLIGV